MTKKIRVLVVEPDGLGEIREIPDTLSAKQEIVGGWIETVTLPGGLIIVCNEEGHRMNLEPNQAIQGFVGTVFFARSAGEEFASITDEDIRRLTE